MGWFGFHTSAMGSRAWQQGFAETVNAILKGDKASIGVVDDAVALREMQGGYVQFFVGFGSR